MLDAANPMTRRRRKPAGDAASDRVAGDGAAASAASPAGVSQLR
jgi:hypothetical protein